MGELFSFGTEIGIAVFAPIIVSFILEHRKNETSCFYAYISNYVEDYINKFKWKSNIFIILCLIVIIILGLEGVLLKFHDIEAIRVARVIGIALITLAVLLQSILNRILAFKNINFLEIKIKECSNDLNNLDIYINSVIIILYIIWLILVTIFNENKYIINILSLSLIMLSFVLEAVYWSFLYIYIKIRNWYHISEIDIITRTDIVYKNILSYRIKNNYIKILVHDNDTIEKIVLPMSEIVCIDKKIDITKTYLSNFCNKGN